MQRLISCVILVVSSFGMPSMLPAQPLIVDPQAEAWNRYVVLGERDISIAKAVQLDGHAHAGGNLDLAKDVVITGDASAGGRVQGQGVDGVVGAVVNFADPVILPVLPSDAELRSMADRVLTGNQVWDDVVIDDVLFVDGVVEIRGALNGQGTLIVSRDLRIKKGPATLESETALSIIALGKLDIEKDRELRAFVRAARDVSIKKNARFEGVLIADGKIDVDKDSILTFLAPPDPDSELVPQNKSQINWRLGLVTSNQGWLTRK